jgi:hypothetical protein
MPPKTRGARTPGNAPSDSPLVRLVARATNASKRWAQLRDDLVASTADGDGVDASNDPCLVRAAIVRARQAGLFEGDAIPVEVAELESWALAKATEIESEFDDQLRHRANDANLELRGRFPDYVIATVLEVSVAPGQFSCSIDGDQFETIAMRVIWPAILAAIAREASRTGEMDRFRAACEQAYRRAVKLEGFVMGAPIPITVLYREAVVTLQSDRFLRAPTSNLVFEYDRERFARDIRWLISNGQLRTDSGGHLEFTASALSKDAILVRLPEGARYIGHFRLRESEA